MPNWVLNNLEVSGEPELLAQMVARISGQNAWGDEQIFSLHRVIPCPESAKSSGNTEDWAVDHWGTKWDVRDPVLEGNPEAGKVEIHFQTAWDPPAPVICALVVEFPGLTFCHRFMDEHRRFAMAVRFEGGDLVEHVDVSDPIC